MRQKMRTVGVAACVVALTALFATHAPAQTGKIDEDLQRAQEILNQLAIGSLDQDSRVPLEEELARIGAHEYVVPVNLTARAYTSGSGYFPVTVWKDGVLDPALEGRIEMPRSTSRRAKSQLNPAYGTVRIHVVEAVTRRATTTLESLWVKVDGDTWYVVSDDTRLHAHTLPLTLPKATHEMVEVRFLIPFDDGSGDLLADATGSVQAEIDGRHRWVDGRYGRALDLMDDALVRLDPTPLLQQASSEVTVGAWTKPNSLDEWQAIAYTTGGHWQLGFLHTTPHLTVWGEKLKATHQAQTQLRVGEWAHIAATYDTRMVRLYVNGVLATESATPGEPALNLVAMARLNIGGDPGGPSRRTDAAIDDLFVTDEALTQAQIVQVMNGFVVATTLQQTAAARQEESRNAADMRAAIARAQEILALSAPQGEFETAAEHALRISEHDTLLPELRAIAAQEFDLPLDVDAVGRYDADAEAYPVTVSRADLLAPAVGSVYVPRSKARQAKAQMKRAWGTTRLRVSQDMREAVPHLVEVAVWLDEKAWPVTFASAWTRGFTLHKDPSNADAWIWDVDFSPDETLVASAGRQGMVRVWDARTSNPERVLDHGYVVNAVRFTPDSAYLLSAGMHSRMRVWSMADGSLVLPISHPGHIADIAVHPLVSHVASGNEAGSVQITDYVTGAVLGAFEVGSAVHRIVYSDDGSMLAVADAVGGVHIRDSATGQDARTFSAGPIAVSDLLPMPGGHLMCVRPKGAVSVWDMATASAVRTHPSERAPDIGSGAYDADLGVLVGAGGGALTAWAVDSATLLQRVDGLSRRFGDQPDVPPAGMQYLAYSPRNETIVAGGAPGRVYSFWRVGAELAHIPLRPVQTLDSVVQDDVLHIPDPNLERVIRDAAGKLDGQLTAGDLASVVEIVAADEGIEDLTGLGKCRSLKRLRLHRNPLQNVDSLSDLRNLSLLDITQTELTDLGFLRSLRKLKALVLSDTGITDLADIAHRTELDHLDLTRNPMTNTTALTQLPLLSILHLAYTGVDDLAFLASMPRLVFLSVEGNGVDDLSGLAATPRLEQLAAGNNQIEDIRPLLATPLLKHVALQRNLLTDIRVLADMPQLSYVNVSHNFIADLQPLVENPGIGPGDELFIRGNPLSEEALAVQIPELVRRGVKVTFYAGAATPPVQHVRVDSTPEPGTSQAVTAVTQASASTSPVPSSALIVGINAYDHHADLINPTYDAQAVEKELREVFRCDTTTLLDATKVEFLTALHGLADREFADDEQLLVFFSGHGYFDERIRRGYLAFKDSQPLENDPFMQSFVSHEDVRVLLERLDCNHVLLVVDSCFSGTLDPMVAMAPGVRAIDNAYGLIPKAEYIRRKLQYRTRRYITAGGKEYVPD
ncbi:hypothetical protein HOI71_27345, partial [Candidatus Poribacteria bacterium]|nr:hypothetical protein [Candidatus Poribacteria bacterium]